MNNIVDKFLNYLNERFGIKKEIFSNYIFDVDKERIKIFSASVGNKNLEGLKIERIGLKAGKHYIKNDQIKFKTSTNFVQIFGIYANKNVVEINDEQVKKYVQGNDLGVNLDIEKGEVIIKWNEHIVGIGSYSQGKIKNQIPKKKRIIKINDEI